MLLCSVPKKQLEFGLTFEIDGIIKKHTKHFFQIAKFSSFAVYLNIEGFVMKRTTHFQSKHWMDNLSNLNMYLFPKICSILNSTKS